jgi:hypothetical protein
VRSYTTKLEALLVRKIELLDQMGIILQEEIDQPTGRPGDEESPDKRNETHGGDSANMSKKEEISSSLKTIDYDIAQLEAFEEGRTLSGIAVGLMERIAEATRQNESRLEELYDKIATSRNSDGGNRRDARIGNDRQRKSGKTVAENVRH